MVKDIEAIAGHFHGSKPYSNDFIFFNRKYSLMHVAPQRQFRYVRYTFVADKTLGYLESYIKQE